MDTTTQYGDKKEPSKGFLGRSDAKRFGSDRCGVDGERRSMAIVVLVYFLGLSSICGNSISFGGKWFSVVISVCYFCCVVIIIACKTQIYFNFFVYVCVPVRSIS